MPNAEPRIAGNIQSCQYTIVIPAYNEAERIVQTLDHILQQAGERCWSVEIIVVDDGSSDATADVVCQYAARNAAVRLIQSPAHRGKGHCVRIGAMHAAGQVIVVTDADLPAMMDETPLLLQALSQGADIAIGSRWLRPELQQIRQSWPRRALGRCFNFFVRWLLGLNYKDTQCGFKAFTREAANLIFRFQTVSGWAFDAELLVIAKGLQLTVEEVPVKIHNDRRSKLKPFLHGFEMLFEVLRIAGREFLGKYPSPAAPSTALDSGRIQGRSLGAYLLPTPARITFAVLALLGTNMFMNDIAAVTGSNRSIEHLSPVTLQGSPAGFQGARQDQEQHFVADEFDYVSDQD